MRFVKFSPRYLSANNAVLVLFLLASSAALAYGVNLLIQDLSGSDPSPFAHTYLPYQIALVALAALFFGGSIFLRSVVKTYIVIVSISATFSVYAGEVYLHVITPGTQLHWVINGGDSSPESRELLLGERRKGREAWPNTSAIGWASHNPDTYKSEFLPLVGISRVTSVVCAEGPNELVFESDEHGFHNPVGVWSQRDIDVLAIGDSFTLGSCVPSAENMVERIRRAYPRTVNLGAGGNGSLLNLGVLREYGPHLRPKIVLWFFFENDLDSWESLIVTANRYLEEPDFEQNLIERQSEIDTRWKSLFRTLENAGTKGPGVMYGGTTLRSVVLLSQLRRRMGLTAFEGWLHGRVELTKRVIERAKSMVSEWGGRLIFVYLPDNYFYLANNARIAHESERIHQAMIEAVSSLQVEAVDMTRAFRLHPDPGTLFSNPRVRSHYSPEGYALVARTVLPVVGEMLAGTIR